MTGSLSKSVTIWTFVITALVMLSAPTVVVLGASFTSGNIITFPPDGLSLKWYGAIAQASDLRQAFVRSLIVAAICTLISIPVGTLAGIALAKYRINPGNVGFKDKRDRQFSAIVDIALKNDKPVRIGVNWGSLDQDLLTRLMDENAKLPEPKDARAVMHEAITQSALLSAERAIELGLGSDKIVLSAKVSAVQDLIQVYAMLAARSDLALHLGLTEAGMGSKGIVASSAALAVLLQQGIGDTIRISLTPEPKGDRTLEVKVAQELLQSMGFRSFVPLVAACPGCGRTTSTTFQELARDIQDFIRDEMPEWKRRYPGVETLTVAVMGCIVNGPGESKHADIGISLPGTGEAPAAPVFIDGKKALTLRGPGAAAEFKQMVLDYIERRYGKAGRNRTAAE